MYKTIRRGALCLFAAVLLQAATAGAQDGFQVVVNPSNPVSSLREGYVSKLFLGKITRWDHGEQVASVDLPARSSTRARFSKNVHGKSISAVQAYWQQQIFSGRGVPPPEVTSDAEVVSFVRRNPGAIGYVSASASVNGLKVVSIRP